MNNLIDSQWTGLVSFDFLFVASTGSKSLVSEASERKS